ncbi:hypothetical protein KKC83_04335 [Patescibacteria group bacterium]|nr:hypothetical protein [Candidatus Falkowbacteria bacterium]MBU3905656.1 hypothetical protein [Patescibacteria group bacterium]MBU4014769.1 hypothetical protein [Patescibacteria group bacterium]MBU4026744.1 hypothetical protein [Patescibacteria group bacterium]MBU4073043.1 hypothetical protein [Patescibacteria group bacterium]
MPTNFNQTVNLREKNSAREKRGEDFYGSYEEEKEGLKKISKPQVKQVNEGFAKRLTVIAAIVLICFTVYWIFYKDNTARNISDENTQVNWYTVKLINDEVYYGQISDLSADPVVISNVYYNYDQIKEDKENTGEAGNIRLVKRGKETHGPSGVMNIVRAQVVYMEPMDEESKVLKAILNYEK